MAHFETVRDATRAWPAPQLMFDVSVWDRFCKLGFIVHSGRDSLSLWGCKDGLRSELVVVNVLLYAFTIFNDYTVFVLFRRGRPRGNSQSRFLLNWYLSLYKGLGWAHLLLLVRVLNLARMSTRLCMGDNFLRCCFFFAARWLSLRW